MYKISLYTLIVLLLYLVKCATRYYCTVIDNAVCFMPYQTSNTLFQFIDIQNIRLVRMIFGETADSVVHQIKVRAVWSSDMNSGVVCARNQTVNYAAEERRTLPAVNECRSHLWAYVQIKAGYFEITPWQCQQLIKRLRNFNSLFYCNFCTSCVTFERLHFTRWCSNRFKVWWKSLYILCWKFHTLSSSERILKSVKMWK